MKKYSFATSLLTLLATSSALHSEPACVIPDANSVVLAWSLSNLADGSGGEWLLQNVETSDRIFLRRCSMSAADRGCYYATNVAPGKYYFQEVWPEGLNSLFYPVSRKGLWFEITGKGVDYIGDWTIDRTAERMVKRLEIKYQLKTLDHMVELCGIRDRKLFLSKTTTAALEIVN